jgi:DNA-binding transcriptional ArsR family regulator
MTNYSAMLAALADPTRRAIFERLATAPSSVGEVARELPVSRPAVSQHLKVLKSAGLVSDKAAGTRRVYSVNPAGIAAIRDYFEQFWQQSLSRFAAAASQQVPDAASQPDRNITQEEK